MRETARGVVAFSGEPLKTEEQYRYIETVGNLIKSSLEDLGTSREIIDPKRIHFLPDLVYRKHFPNNSCATYYDIPHAIVIRTGNHTRVDYIHMLTEEMLHATSQRLYVMDIKTGKPRCTGVGYQISDGRFSLLRGFNEGVTNSIKLDLLSRFLTRLTRQLSLNEDETRALTKPSRHREDYPLFRNIVSLIINKAAARENLSRDAVFRKLKKGMFANHQETLTLIESIFGRQGLEFLAYLGCDSPDLDKTILNYLTKDDPAEKSKLAKDVQQRVPTQTKNLYQAWQTDSLADCAATIKI